MVENCFWDSCPSTAGTRWPDLPRDGSVQLIDIRTPAEFERGALPEAYDLLDELRERLGELIPAARAPCLPKRPAQP